LHDLETFRLCNGFLARRRVSTSHLVLAPLLPPPQTPANLFQSVLHQVRLSVGTGGGVHDSLRQRPRAIAFIAGIVIQPPPVAALLIFHESQPMRSLQMSTADGRRPKRVAQRPPSPFCLHIEVISLVQFCDRVVFPSTVVHSRPTSTHRLPIRGRRLMPPLRVPASKLWVI